MQILNNPWVIGIGGGILSGFVVTYLSRKLLSKRDDREYAQKVLGANREIIYAIRPGISEGLTPEYEVIDSLIAATARKYGVDKPDLYEPRDIAQELVKEVMDSSFISAKTKEEYCRQLAVLFAAEGAERPQTPTQPPAQTKSAPGIEEYRKRMVAMMSLMAGMLTAFMTLFLFVSEGKSFSLSSFNVKLPLSEFLIPLVATMVAMIAAVYTTTLLRESRMQRRKLESHIELKRASNIERDAKSPSNNRRAAE